MVKLSFPTSQPIFQSTSAPKRDDSLRDNSQWAWITSLPNNPHQDYGAIQVSGISREEVRLGVNVLAVFTDAIAGKGWGATLGKRLNMTEVHVRKVAGGLQAEVVIETTVEQDMLNIFGSLHGSCSAWLIDMCSSTPLVTLGLLQRMDSTGVSQAMNIIYHGPAPLGTKLRIISTSLTNEGKIRVARCEIRNKDTNALLVSAVHTKVGGATKAVAKM